MSEKINNKKELAEKLKARLNSPEYIAMSDLIIHDDRHGDMLTWLWGKSHGRADRNWISGTDINPYKGNKKESENIVYQNELEKDDWEEIVNLIEKRNKEKEQIFETKINNIEQKLNQQSNLYYYWGASWRKRERNENADVWVTSKGMCGFVTLLGGRGNGLTYHLYIAENHPVLNNFPFKAGFYLVETDRPIEKRVGRYNGYSSTGGESNPFNFTKFVEAGDQITITPYSVETNQELPENQKGLKRKEKCDNCQKNWIAFGSEGVYLGYYRGDTTQNRIHICNECYREKETEYLQNYGFIYSYDPEQLKKGGTGYVKNDNMPCYAGKTQNGQILEQRNCPHCQPWKHQDIDKKTISDITNYLIQYFQEHDIKKIELDNDKLIITYNNNEIIANDQINNNSEYQTIKNSLDRIGKNEINQSELSDLVNSNSPAIPGQTGNDNVLLIVFVIGGTLLVGVAVGLLLSRRKKWEKKI